MSGSNRKEQIQVRRLSVFSFFEFGRRLTRLRFVDLVYPSGMSVTLPEDVQERVMRSIKGLEEVTMVRPGYGVEVRRLPSSSFFESAELTLHPFLVRLRGPKGAQE